MLCKVCGEPIPEERLEAIPGTDTCVAHSQARRQLGFMIATAAKGTASVMVTVPDDPEQRRLARRAHMRRR